LLDLDQTSFPGSEDNAHPKQSVTGESGGEVIVTDSTADSAVTAPKAEVPVVRTVTHADVLAALAQGLRDFRAAPLYGLFFGGVYAAGGWGLLFLLNWMEVNYYVYPMATGFAMIAPFIAAGLYEVSRRLEAGAPLTWHGVLASARTAGGKDLSWMVVVTTFAYIIWIDIAIALYLMFYGLKPLAFTELVTAIVTTPAGALFFLVGNAVGALLATMVFSLTVVSFPLLFERHVDFVTAMITSCKVVLVSPGPMALWAAIIAVLLMISFLSVFVALVAVLPVLGHATWHLYRRAVEVDSTTPG
jgi:uncharacterized membrane protein